MRQKNRIRILLFSLIGVLLLSSLSSCHGHKGTEQNETGEHTEYHEPTEQELWAEKFALSNVTIKCRSNKKVLAEYLVKDGLVRFTLSGRDPVWCSPASGLERINYADHYEAFTLLENGSYYAKELPLLLHDGATTFFDVTVTFEHTRIQKISYREGSADAAEQVYSFSDWNETEVTVPDWAAYEMALYDALAMKHFQNFSLEETRASTDTVSKALERYDGYLRFTRIDSAGNFERVDEDLRVNRNYVKEGISDTRKLLRRLNCAKLTYNVLTGVYTYSEILETANSDGGKTRIKNLSFTLKDGRLSSLAYDEEIYRKTGVMKSKTHCEALFSDYGTTKIETEPMEESLHQSVFDELSRKVNRRVRFYEKLNGQVTDTEITIYKNGTYDIISDGREWVTLLGQTAPVEAVRPIEDLLDYLKSLDPADFVKTSKTGLLDTYAYKLPSTYAGEVTDSFEVMFGTDDHILIQWNSPAGIVKLEIYSPS